MTQTAFCIHDMSLKTLGNFSFYMKADTVSQKLLGYVIKPPEQLVISNSSSSNPSKLIKRPITAVSQSQKDDK